MNRTKRSGFTLLEMMVVIVIIGVLSTYLVVNVPQFLDSAKMTANERNQRELFTHLTMWQGNHNGNWPADSGQRFFIRPWKDGQIEKTEQQAIRFFSPSMPFEECAATMGVDPESMTIMEYLSDWDSIGPGYTSYAGFNSKDNPDARRDLRENPGSTTIISDAEKWHRAALIYTTGDGASHRMLRAEIEERTGINFDERGTIFAVGPGCGVEELETVTND